MKSYIPHRILVINSGVTESADDAVIMKCFRLAFDWANRMGKQGKRVFDLFLQKPDQNNHNPLRQQMYLWCKIECTIEERERWDEIQKLNIQHAVFTALKDDDETD